jgi:hypothetical protein
VSKHVAILVRRRASKKRSERLNIEDLVSKRLIEQVPSDWWGSEDGLGFLKRQEQKQGWIQFLGGLGFDTWFTITFRDNAMSATLAIDRTKRLLKRACKEIKRECNAFIVAEQHLSGAYHTHGMMRVGSLSKDFEELFMRYMWQVAFEAYGRNSFSSIGDSDAVSAYVAKYLVKRVGEWTLIGCKRIP